MAPQLALYSCIIGILYLFWIDRKRAEWVSGALWIPTLWMALAGSRFVSQWIDYEPQKYMNETYIEGSSLDSTIFALLIILAVVAISRKKKDGAPWLLDNKWVYMFFIFGLASLLWSDYPFVAFKRLIKAFGNCLMVLVILTEERPYHALGVLLTRLSLILLPLSVVLIKYYPELGRAYHMGVPLFSGVAAQKNGLGQICLICGIYYAWNLIVKPKDHNLPNENITLKIYIVIIPILLWLLYLADSATSTVCLVIAIGFFSLSQMPFVIKEPKRILNMIFFGTLICFLIEIIFDISDEILFILGRDATLTTRVPMWEHLMSMVQNPLVGYGFESFWIGDRQQEMVGTWGLAKNAHNGYLDMYLNLGIIGLCFLTSWVISGLIKLKKMLNIDYPVAILKLSFIFVFLFYNWTEATIYGINNMWILLLVAVMDAPSKNTLKL